MKPMKEMGFDEAFLERQRKLALQDAKELRERLQKMKASTKGSAVGKKRKKSSVDSQDRAEKRTSKKD